jgi:predicted nucleotidyltransferase
MSVPVGFQLLLAKIQPLTSELAHANAHANTVKARLLKSFGLRRLMVVGSHSRGTAIRQHSDVDLFAVFTRDEARWGDRYVSSDTLLSKLKADLEARYWQTPVRHDMQAVVVDFGDGCKVDVVPAVFWEMGATKRPIFQMPDGDGQWMPTSPESHNKYIQSANLMSGGKLQRTARLIKFWRECRTPRVPVSSFHIELVLAAEGVCKGVKGYGQSLYEAFQLLASRECRGYRDPLAISGYVRAVKTENHREYALREARYARDHAAWALEAESSRNVREAYRQWNLVRPIWR